MSTEFLRFVVTGGVAAVANILSRLLLSQLVPFEVAVVVSYVIGMITAFVLARQFVFNVSDRGIRSEAVRFVVVNLVALVQVWIVSVGLADWLFPMINFVWHRELVAHSIGVFSPVVTSYFGHKKFTFG